MRADPGIRAVRVQFDKPIGKIKYVNGICNGPISPEANLSEDYKCLKIPFVRFHDTGGDISRFYIDVSRVFPDFDRNENAPGNYMFEYTDVYVSAAVNAGAQIIYRLGESIDDTGIGRYARPPRYFDKWSEICIHIIKHYNDGWANGFHYGIKFWEIWNEPDNSQMWADGNDLQAFRLYEAAATAIKRYDGTLYVGGMAFTAMNQTAKDFIKYCADRRLPLDFFSYHYYGSNPKDIEHLAVTVGEFLDSNGYDNTFSVLDEWNYIGLEREFDVPLWTMLCDPTPLYSEIKREIFEKQSGMPGASFCAAAMITMNSAGVDVGCYYDGQPGVMRWCGLYDRYLNRQKPFYAFKAFSELCGESVAVSTVGDGIYSAAAKTCDGYNVLISSFRGGDAQLFCEGLPKDRYFNAEIYTLDGRRNLEPSGQIAITNSKFRLDVGLGKYGVVLIKIK